jgi:galactokinase
MASFAARYGRQPDVVASAPGRVNLIGEHLDYNDGLVLPVAIGRRTAVACAVRGDDEVRAYSERFHEEGAFSLAGPIRYDGSQPWSNYVRGVFAVLLERGYGGPGLDLWISSDLPQGAGLSSSAALEVAVAGAVRAAWDCAIEDADLARIAQQAENAFVGVQCGIMDQLAATVSRARHALLIDCRDLRYEYVPLDLGEHGMALVMIDSGVRRQLEASAYNERREECAEALRLFSNATPTGEMSSLRDLSREELEERRAALPEALYRRTRHVVTETARVEAAVEALQAADFREFSRLMGESHVSLRDDFEVSCAELDLIVALAEQAPGVIGSRLTGAGFGGVTVHLVEKAVQQEFASFVMERYVEESGRSAGLYECVPSDGLRVETIGT